MTKRQLIDEILEFNRSAEPGFLARFDDPDLAEYLRHLRCTQEPPAALDDRPFIVDRNGDEIVVAAAAAEESHLVAPKTSPEPILF